MAANLLQIAALRLGTALGHFELQIARAYAILETAQNLYQRRIRRQILLSIAAGLIGFAFNTVFWCIPPYLLYRYYLQTWTEWWWEKGGKWADPRAFPEYRVSFIVLLYCLPIWAGYMASIMIGWSLVSRVFRTLFRRLRSAGRRRAHFSTDSVELDPILEDNGDPAMQQTSKTWSRATQQWHIAWWFLLSAYLSLAIFGLYCWNTFDNELDWRKRSQIDYATEHYRPEGYAKGEKIFVTALFHNNEAVLPHWTMQMQRLLLYLGPENVYISILDSYSTDNTANILEAWASELTRDGIRHRIITRDTTIHRPYPMSTDHGRINFLSASRNRALEPLEGLDMKFDRILFSNDVFVHAESLVELLNTRDGDYDVACGLDFAQWGLYDLWVTRDRYGDFGSMIYPYLIERAGFEAIERQEPAPVFTCWNGVFVTRAEPFYSPQRRPARNASVLSSEPLTKKLTQTHPSAAEFPSTPPRDLPALRFRSSGPDECFSSECHLLPYDLRRRFGLEKHYINPLTISAYIWDHYVVFKYIMRHWLVWLWISRVEEGHRVHKGVMTVGDPERVYSWDGGMCHGIVSTKRSMEEGILFDPRAAIDEWRTWESSRQPAGSPRWWQLRI